MSPPPSSSPLLIANLIGQLAFGLLAMTICIPSMQEWGAIFGASQASVQLTFSGYVLTYGCLQLVYGPLSDRWGRKRLLMVGLVLSFAGSLLAALAPTLPLLTAARVLQGAGAAAGMVIGRALVQDLFHGPGRTRVMAWIGMAMGLCPPTATILGGQLHVSLGWQANFFVMAGLAVLLFIAAWRGLPSHQPPAGVQSHWLGSMLSSYAQLAREPGFRLYVVLVSMTTATFYTFLGGAPLVLGSYSHPLEDQGNALAHADAHGAQRVLARVLVQAVHGGGDQARAAGAQRVAQRNGAAPGVHARVVVLEAQPAQHGQALRGKGFVQLDHVHLVQVRPVSASTFCVAGAGPKPMMRGATPAVAMPTTRARGVRPYLAAWLRRPAAGAGAVVHAAGVARRHRAIGPHHALELGQRFQAGFARVLVLADDDGGPRPFFCGM
jgi:MFS family permease